MDNSDLTNEWLTIAENLEVGQFIRYHKKQLDVIKVREFQAKRKPVMYLHFEQEQEPQTAQADYGKPKPRPQPRRPIPKPKWLANLLSLIPIP